MKISEKQVFDMIKLLIETLETRSGITVEYRIAINKLLQEVRDQQSTELLDTNIDANFKPTSKSEKEKDRIKYYIRR